MVPKTHLLFVDRLLHGTHAGCWPTYCGSVPAEPLEVERQWLSHLVYSAWEMGYFGCATPASKVAWCLFSMFTFIWVFLVTFVLIYGWQNLFFVFIVSAMLFLFSMAPLCFLACIAEQPLNKKEARERAEAELKGLPIAPKSAFGSGAKSNAGMDKKLLEA